MPVNVLMPALSPTMEKGNLTKWLRNEGDTIKAGDVIAEIETDKATMEVEAVDEGVLAKIIVPAGTPEVAVNQIIAVIALDGEDPSTVTAGASPAVQAAGKSASGKSASAKSDSASVAAPSGAPASVPAPVAGIAPAKQQPNIQGSATRIFASPLARRIAREAGVDLSAVTGSGPHGRIVEKDVRQALAAGVATLSSAKPNQPAAQPVVSGMTDDAVRRLFQPGSYEEIPHDSMRRTIARRLVEAKSTVPHFYLSVDVDIDALLALREQINAQAPQSRDGKSAFKISVNDMIIKAYALALKAVPDANVSWTEAAMLRHKTADIGVAVSIPGGLITPIIRDAAGKTLSSISSEMKELASRARDKRLKPEEYQGGSGAVSNLGMFGIKSFSAVINPPHATILAVGAGIQQPVVRNGEIRVATLMSLTLSTDHRAVDGVLGAQLLQAIRGYLENPVSMLV